MTPRQLNKSFETNVSNAMPSRNKGIVHREARSSSLAADVGFARWAELPDVPAESQAASGAKGSFCSRHTRIFSRSHVRYGRLVGHLSLLRIGNLYAGVLQ